MLVHMRWLLKAAEVLKPVLDVAVLILQCLAIITDKDFLFVVQPVLLSEDRWQTWHLVVLLC